MVYTVCRAMFLRYVDSFQNATPHLSLVCGQCVIKVWMEKRKIAMVKAGEDIGDNPLRIRFSRNIFLLRIFSNLSAFYESMGDLFP